MDEYGRKGYSPAAVANWTRDTMLGHHGFIDTRRGHMEWLATTVIVLGGFLIFIGGVVYAAVTRDITGMTITAFVAVIVALIGVVWRADIRSRYVKKKRDAVNGRLTDL